MPIINKRLFQYLNINKFSKYKEKLTANRVKKHEN